MSAQPNTLTFPGVTRPFREAGSSALDQRSTWSPPEPAEMVFDRWGAPAPGAAVLVGLAPWPAPDPQMRVDMPAPAFAPPIAASLLVEPMHPIDMPVISPFAAPTLADAAENLTFDTHVAAAPTVAHVQPDASGVGRRLVFAVAAVAGIAAAAGAAALALF